MAEQNKCFGLSYVTVEIKKNDGDIITANFDMQYSTISRSYLSSAALKSKK